MPSAIPPATRLSPTCQQITRQDLDGSPSTAKVVVRSCLGDKDLQPIVLDHKCNDCVLTPSGLYTDMVVTVAGHIYRAYEGANAELPGIHIGQLQVHKPLLVKDVSKIDQLCIEMEVVSTGGKADGSRGRGSTSSVMDIELKCIFHSVTPGGVRLQEMGHCTAQFEQWQTWLDEWAQYTPIILDRIESLRVAAIKEDSLQVQLVQREQAYKLFESFVQYGKQYQNMSEVAFDTKTLEATSTVDFLHIDPEKHFAGPYYMDGSCHVSGFVCNAVERDKVKFAYINGGVGSIKLSPNFRPASGSGVIRNYVQMRPLANDKTVLQGDVFVLQDDEIVGVWEQVRFKRIPRKVLNVFLPPTTTTAKNMSA